MDECFETCFKPEVVSRARAALPSASELRQRVALFGALADPTRLSLLHALKAVDELCVCDAAHALKITVSTASHHLRLLRESGLVKHRTDGKMVYYSLKAPLVRKLLDRAARAA